MPKSGIKGVAVQRSEEWPKQGVGRDWKQGRGASGSCSSSGVDESSYKIHKTRSVSSGLVLLRYFGFTVSG